MKDPNDIAELQKELLRQWEFNHAEHCRNKWPHEGVCCWPIPEIVFSLTTDVVAKILEGL